jgi:hypothetical protein
VAAIFLVDILRHAKQQMIKSNHVQRIQTIYQHLYPTKHSSQQAFSGGYSKPFRTIHTGIVNDPDAATFEKKRQLRLDLRINDLSDQQRENVPYTSLVLLDHIFHISKLLRARHIHLKYIEASGDCYIMFRTEHGLVTYSTVNNRHWIKYMLMHATGQEDPEKAGEGEFRLEALSDRDGRMEYTVNIVYIQGGIKMTLAPVE